MEDQRTVEVDEVARNSGRLFMFGYDCQKAGRGMLVARVGIRKPPATSATPCKLHIRERKDSERYLGSRVFVGVLAQMNFCETNLADDDENRASQGQERCRSWVTWRCASFKDLSVNC